MNDNSVSRIPEFDAVTMLQQRLAQKQTEASPSQPSLNGAIDPYKMMLQRKAVNSGEIQAPIQSWPEEDIKNLEEFCLKMGVVGFNCGRMSPAAALAFLKQKLGVVEDVATSEGMGPNYPYTEALQKRVLLKG